MSQAALTQAAANYRLPPLGTKDRERCRDCAESRKTEGYGNTIGCRWHQVNFVRHSHRCDNWHAKGTLL